MLYLLQGIWDVNHSISRNVLRKVRFCCNFNFDAWFQRRNLKKKRKAVGVHHCIILLFCSLLQANSVSPSLLLERILSSNSILIYFVFILLNKTEVKGMMKEIYEDWIPKGKSQDINGLGSHCYFGVYLCWIGVIHPGLHYKNCKEERIRNDRKTLTTLLS